MAHPEFTLLGDAVWLDFVNTARGRTPHPPDLLPGRRRVHRWAHAQRLIDLNGGAPHPAVRELRGQLTALAEALDAGLQPPAGSIAAINDLLAGSTGSHQLTRVSGEWRLQFAPRTAAGPAGSDRPLGRAHPGRPAGAVRRCAGETCSLFFADSSPNHSRRWCAAACGPTSAGRAAARGAPLTAPDPRVGLRPHPGGARAALPPGAHRRLVRGAGAVRGARRGPQAPRQPPGQLLSPTRRPAPGSCARPRRSASWTIPRSATSTTPGQSAISPTGSELDRRRRPRGCGAARAPADSRWCTRWRATCWARWSTPTCNGIIVRAISPLSVLLSAGGRGTVTDLRFCSYCLPAIPPGIAPPAQPLHGAGGPRGRRRRSRHRRLHRRRAALLRRHRPGAAARPARSSAGRPSCRPTCPRAIERIVMRALQPAPDDALPHRRGDAGGLRLRRGHLRRSAGGRRRGRRSRRTRTRPAGRSGCAAPWATTTSCSTCSARAGSAACTGCATSTSSARSRSRCCTRR